MAQFTDVMCLRGSINQSEVQFSAVWWLCAKLIWRNEQVECNSAENILILKKNFPYVSPWRWCMASFSICRHPKDTPPVPTRWSTKLFTWISSTSSNLEASANRTAIRRQTRSMLIHTMTCRLFHVLSLTLWQYLRKCRSKPNLVQEYATWCTICDITVTFFTDALIRATSFNEFEMLAVIINKDGQGNSWDWGYWTRCPCSLFICNDTSFGRMCVGVFVNWLVNNSDENVLTNNNPKII